MKMKYILTIMLSVFMTLSVYGQGRVVTRKSKVTTKATTPKTKKSTKTVVKPTTESLHIVSFYGEYVDLGLPSGTLWADRNLGAHSPTDNGVKYAWGKKSKTKSNTSTVYFNIGGWDLNIVPTQISNNWILPTADQFYEIATVCQFIEFKEYGIDCYKVIGPNGNFILLPISANSNGEEYFWTSTITDYSYSLDEVTYNEKRPVAYSSTVSNNQYRCPVPQTELYIRPVKSK